MLMDDSDSVTRREHELALRRTNLTISMLRDQLLQLGAQVVTLTEALAEREVIDDDSVTGPLAAAVHQVRCTDEANNPLRLTLGESLIDKYEVESPPIPCDELLHLCEGRCCKLTFALTTQDLDEVKVRWNYALPYSILQRDNGYCVHNDATSRGCAVYECRPTPCREFDCRDDKHIWLDYDKRIPAPAAAIDDGSADAVRDRAKIEDKVRQHQVALTIEELALSSSHADKGSGMV